MSDFIIDRIDFDGELCCSNDTHILIVDYKQLKYTQHIISNLLIQDATFDLTIFEQVPDENTKAYMEKLKKDWNLEGCSLNVVYNSVNAPLNHIWNWFYRKTKNKYIAFLNNDLEICDNLISDAEKIFSFEEKCGIIVHPTNNPQFTKKKELVYKFDNRYFLQGWDFIIRHEIYEPIPDELFIWSGDNWLLQEVIKKGYGEVYDISSPVLHYCSKTINENKEFIEKQCKKDAITFKELYLNNTTNHRTSNKYSNRNFNGIYPIDLTKKIIVSFTSWEKRIDNIPFVIEQMMKQTRRPDKIIVNLSEEEFKEKENLLSDIKEIEGKNDIFEINMVSGPNTKVWKKWIPIVDKYKNDLICAIDDDMKYPVDFIERLYNKWLENPYNPISGAKVKLGDWLQCHCGAGSLFFRTAYGIYMNDYRKLMGELCASDVFYSFSAYMNGYEYVSEGMNVLKFERYNETSPYSQSRKKIDKPVHIFDFEFLTDFYINKEKEKQSNATINIKNEKYTKILELHNEIKKGLVIKTTDEKGKPVFLRLTKK